MNKLVLQSGDNNRVLILNISVLPFKFQLFQMRVWITPPSRQEHLTPPRSSWDPGRNPGSPSSEEVLQLSCMRLHSSDHIFIIKFRGVRRNDYVSEGTKHVVKSKPCLLAEEPVIFKLWSETKPGQDKILSTKLLPPDLLPKLRPTTPLQNYVPFWQIFFKTWWFWTFLEKCIPSVGSDNNFVKSAS